MTRARSRRAGPLRLARVAALFLILPAFAVAAADAPEIPAVPPARVTDNATLVFLIKSVQDNIARIRREDPTAVEPIVEEYNRLLAQFPDADQGKLAGIEALLVLRNANRAYPALGQIARMLRTYAAEESFPNVAAPEKPLSLPVSLRIARARLLAGVGDTMGAIETLRTIPAREIRGAAGLVDGERTYYGPARVLIGVGLVDAFIAAGETRQAAVKLEEILRADGGEKTYHEKREGAVDQDLMDRVQAIARTESWDLPRALIEYQRLGPLLRTDGAKAELLEMTATAYLGRFRVSRNRPDALAARDQDVAMVDAYPGLIESRAEGEGLRVHRLGDRILDAIVDLYLRELDDPSGARAFLEELSSRFAKDPTLAARCLLLTGDVAARALHDPDGARLAYNKLLERHGDLVYYPHVLPDVPRYRSVARERLESLTPKVP